MVSLFLLVQELIRTVSSGNCKAETRKMYWTKTHTSTFSTSLATDWVNWIWANYFTSWDFIDCENGHNTLQCPPSGHEICFSTSRTGATLVTCFDGWNEPEAMSSHYWIQGLGGLTHFQTLLLSPLEPGPDTLWTRLAGLLGEEMPCGTELSCLGQGSPKLATPQLTQGLTTDPQVNQPRKAGPSLGSQSAQSWAK